MLHLKKTLEYTTTSRDSWALKEIASVVCGAKVGGDERNTIVSERVTVWECGKRFTLVSQCPYQEPLSCDFKSNPSKLCT